MDNFLGIVFPTFEAKTSEREQILFCCQIVPYTISPSPPKDETVACKYRRAGNECFKNADYERALKLYTQSVAYTPYEHQEDKKMLALVLANRSAALFYIKAYKQCLTEIDNAIQAGYPGGLQYKLHDRKGKCYLALNLMSPAKAAFEKALSFLEKTTLEKSKKDSIRTSLMKQLNDCDSEVGIPNDAKNPNPMNKVYTLPVLEKKNCTHPSLTSACDVKYSQGKGRYFKANRDIAAGEVILVEEPYVANLELDNCLDHCHHCFKQALAPIACRKCTFALYCSAACRDISWENYHQYECSIDFTKHLEHGMVTLRIYRMISTARNDLLHNYSKTRMSKNMEGGNPEADGCNDNGLYISTDYNAVRSLISHSDIMEKMKLFETCLKAVYLMKCLEKSTFFTAIPDSEIEEFKLYIVKELWHGLNVSIVNGRLIRGRAFNESLKATMKDLGFGIYAASSLQNHVCNPNSFEVFYGRDLIVISWKPIMKGQEVTCSYCGDYYHVSKEERRQRLKQYHFECKCNACINNWPLLNDIGDEDFMSKFKNHSAFMKCNNLIITAQKKSNAGDIAGASVCALELLTIADKFTKSTSKVQLAFQDVVRDTYKTMAYCYNYPEPVIDYFEVCKRN